MLSIADAPHVQFVEGNFRTYEEYNEKGLIGDAFMDAHTPEDFQRLTQSFQPSWFRGCVYGMDGIARHIIVDKNNIIRDGVLRVSLAFALVRDQLHHVSSWVFKGSMCHHALRQT